MKLSVIVLNYNVRYFLELCLQSVQDALKSIEAEIIVVDNSSSDDSCEMVKERFPEVKLIENTQNLGFSKGNNIGVAESKGEYICILNPDTVIAEDTFIQILEFAKSKSNFGIVGCQLIDGTGKFLPESKRHIPTAKIAFQKMMGKSDHYYNRNIENDDVGKTDILVGAFMMLRRDVYNEVGGFDEDYFMYGEDIDLSFKILKAGYSNFYFGKTSIIHFKGESTFKDKVYAKRFYQAMAIFYRKHFERNSLFTAMVKLAIKVGSQKGKSIPKLKKIKIKKSILVSNGNFETMTSKLQQPFTQVSRLPEISENSQVVLDANHLGYKAIIEYMKSSDTSKSISYRILPKNSTFIIGSDSSVQRGEVLHF
ncbi:glycosyltransferase family 2 protein [Winogradskyella ursingii]|uniref:glycosyltransferase family 2 protein n=1 Tax=Winogradskyella ursingii TaxID=2686079 RepID=UPI0015C891F4|nr:glycosyltransferase family 2 protein [Winogradskyella ursingii]